MQINLRLHARQVIITLFGILAFLLAFHVMVATGHILFQQEMGALTVLFDMDREANMPTLFNVLLFFVGALLFYLLSRTVEGRARWPWLLMTAVFIFLGFDEGSQIHEKLMVVMLRLMGGADGEMGFLFYAWIIPYFIATLALAALLLPWMLRLEPQLRWGFILSGCIYVFGAVFMESYSGKIAEEIIKEPWDAADHPWMPCYAYLANQCMLYADGWYVMLYTIEETMEMTGLILCSGFLMRALERREAKVTLELGKP